MKKLLVLFLTLTTFYFSYPQSVYSISCPLWTTEELMNKAHLIVMGKITATEYRTRADLRIDQNNNHFWVDVVVVLKGSSDFKNKSLRVDTMFYIFDRSFYPQDGESVILFLRRGEDDNYTTFCDFTGIFRIRPDFTTRLVPSEP